MRRTVIRRDVLFNVNLIAGLSGAGEALTLQQFRNQAGGFQQPARVNKRQRHGEANIGKL